MKASTYLSQRVNYGGEWVTIGWLYAEMGDRAGSWLAGYERCGGVFR